MTSQSIYCPDCGKENPVDAKQCSSCWRALDQPLPESKNAVTSLVASIIAGVMLLLLIIKSGWFMSFESSIVVLWAPIIMLLALVGGILGFTTLRKTGQAGWIGGAGLAKTAIGISLVVLLLGVVILPRDIGVQSRAYARLAACESNVQTLLDALEVYRIQNGNKFPDADKWSDELLTIVQDKSKFICPGDAGAIKKADDKRSSYAFNAELAGKGFEALKDPNIVIFFESDRGWNAAGETKTLPSKSRHADKYIFGFADRHVEALKRGEKPHGPQVVEKH